MRLEVEDDGPGITAPTPSPGSGTGLANTRERLDQAYGDAHRMEIRDAGRPGEAPGPGTLVILELPARRGAVRPTSGGPLAPDAANPAGDRGAAARG